MNWKLFSLIAVLTLTAGLASCSSKPETTAPAAGDAMTSPAAGDAMTSPAASDAMKQEPGDAMQSPSKP